MIPPDQEIYEVEERLAARRALLRRRASYTGRRAVRSLTSPLVLLGAVAIGFLAAGGASKPKPPHPERRKEDHTKAAKATGIAGVLMSGAMWFVRAKYGGPVQLAQVLLEKFQQRRGKPVAGWRQAPPRSSGQRRAA